MSVLEEISLGCVKMGSRISDAEEDMAIGDEGASGPEVGDDHGVLFLSKLIDREYLRYLLTHFLRHVHIHH